MQKFCLILDLMAPTTGKRQDQLVADAYFKDLQTLTFL
jgi:hypothetical protein